jgi:hypothetical protein
VTEGPSAVPGASGERYNEAMQTPVHLNHHQRDTLEQVFRHPNSHNVEWHRVLSLLSALGDVDHEHEGRVRVIIGERTVVVHPKGKDLGDDDLVHLRHLLTEAGLAP